MENNAAAGLVEGLVKDVQENLNFRAESARVGAIYTMSYQSATVAIYDYDREKAGGLPKGGFLVAAEPQGDKGFILLRILKGGQAPECGCERPDPPASHRKNWERRTVAKRT